MEVSAIPNDTRGWIMTVVSGIACTIGASIICVDLIICHVPGKKDFKLEQSNVFTAASMSLSFGVMAFTSLYGMLPSSKNYLLEGGMAPSRAAWTVIGCFVAGFVGIQIAMRIIHKWMPSHVVDCEHTHDESKANVDGDHVRGRESHRHVHGYDGTASETSPLLPTHENGHGHRKLSHRPSLPLLREESGPPVFVDSPSRQQSGTSSQRPSISVTVGRRPSIQDVGNRVMSFVKDKKTNCDSAGPCFGYSEPCGQECLKNKVTLHLTPSIGLLRKATSNRRVSATPTASTHEEYLDAACSHNEERESGRSSPDYLSKSAPDLRNVDEEAAYFDMNGHHEGEAQHHHHVPQNAFLSIGLQTTIAIALHKLPEGFITYATNHANPALGLAVFMALFIHNVTEGFAMALPLYLALGNRWKAMLWSSLLGGISQPLGAGIAALWFTLAGNTNKPGEKLYGCMFAITAGLMTSVALGLFIEGLSQTHNRNLCTFFALVGMAIMGCSNALTA